MNSPFDSFPSEESYIKILIEKFEEKKSAGMVPFFDVEEFEDIIDYYLAQDELDVAGETIISAKGQHPYSSEIKLKEAEVLATQKKYPEAMEILEDLEYLEKGNPDSFLSKPPYWLKWVSMKNQSRHWADLWSLPPMKT